MNAAQAMGGQGAIDVAIGPVDGALRVAIADAGPGMPADVREQAFEPFFTTKHRGTGLGLPIARRIVEAHGGAMTIDVPASGGTIDLDRSAGQPLTRGAGARVPGCSAALSGPRGALVQWPAGAALLCALASIVADDAAFG